MQPSNNHSSTPLLKSALIWYTISMNYQITLIRMIFRPHLTALVLSLLLPVAAHCWSFFGMNKINPLIVPIRFTLMIDPAGDAKEPGRAIDDTFERGITLQLAEELKRTIEAENPGVRLSLQSFRVRSSSHYRTHHLQIVSR